MPTPKRLRNHALNAVDQLDRYVLTRVLNKGLIDVNWSRLDRVPVIGDPIYGAPSSPLSRQTEEWLPIGFDFSFDQRVYRYVLVSTCGFVMLCEDNVWNPLARLNQLITPDTSDYQYNNKIITDGTSLPNGGTQSSTMLLAPWYTQLINAAATPPQLRAVDGLIDYTSEQWRQIERGLLPMPPKIQGSKAGIFYGNASTNKGRCLIIRWNSYNDYSVTYNFIPSVVKGDSLKFEIVLYENGLIEFNYDKPDIKSDSYSLYSWMFGDGPNIVNGEVQLDAGATIGIFSGRDDERYSIRRFRDFATRLGYRDQERPEHDLGGATRYASFVDSYNWYSGNAEYAIGLDHVRYWPGSLRGGASFIFTPPSLLGRKKILPKLEVKHDNVSKPRVSGPFDDRQTVNYVSQNVSMPTTLTRYHARDSQQGTDRLNLFPVDNDFVIQSRMSKISSDIQLTTKPVNVAEPFNESLIQPKYGTEFYSGSIELELSQPLSSKAQIRFELPVNHTIKMLENTGSIYYYNKQTKSWNTPENCLVDLTNALNSSLDVFSKFPGGFSPLGMQVISSSIRDVLQLFNGYTSDDVKYSGERLIKTLSFYDTGSVFINQRYNATDDQLISLSVDRPFILEKAIIEIPLGFGQGWFEDKTTSRHLLVQGIDDFGGPGLTVSLSNQVQYGKLKARELIVSATLTHTNDTNSNEFEIHLVNSPATDAVYVHPRSFTSHGGWPSVVVPAPQNGSVSGTYRLEMISQVSNGLEFNYTFISPGYMGSPVYSLQDVLDFVSAPTIDLSYNDNSRTSLISHVNSFGRSTTGFECSGRSIFGKEFVIPTIESIVKNPNPYHYADGPKNVSQLTLGQTGSMPATLANALLLASSSIRLQSVKSVEKGMFAPYLIRPEDKLILAISKCRPCYRNLTAGGEFSGSIVHDVSLISGTIGVTLFGTYLREGKELPPSSKKLLSSPSISDVIGDKPIEDEFDVDYTKTNYGTYVDDVVMGDLLVRQGSRLVPGNPTRGRVFSNVDLTDSLPAGTGPYDFSLRQSYRLQPNNERVGGVYTSQHFTNGERYYDSLTPNVYEGLRTLGIEIVYWPDNLASGFTNGVGILHSQYQPGLLTIYTGLNIPVDVTWFNSFPFEPLYSRVERMKTFSNSLLTTTSVIAGPEIIRTSLRPVNQLIVQLGGPNIKFEFAVTNTSDQTTYPSGYLYPNVHSILDKDTFGQNLSLSEGEISKLLFGFGDQTSYFRYTYNNVITFNGWTHLPTFRKHVTGDGYISLIIRGWKYGLVSGFPTYSKTHWRKGRFGQLRDMLEQRLDTTWFNEQSANVGDETLVKFDGTSTPPVVVKFLDYTGKSTDPELTWSSNLSTYATSSLPYFDGESRNRPSVNPSLLNTNVIVSL